MTKTEFINKNKNEVFRKKLELERTMTRDIKKYFANEKKRIASNKDISTIRPILENHYKRIYKAFKKKDKKETSQDKLVELANARAKMIDDTSQEDFMKSVTLAREELAKEGDNNPSSEILLLVASRIYFNYGKNRSGTIANTETQEIAELLRNELAIESIIELENAIANNDIAEVNRILNESPSYTAELVKKKFGIEDVAVLFAILAMAEKTWQTMGDGKVRDKHKMANGQTVKLTEPFFVGGELLKYPGDMSLGASLGNIINCRCVCVYL